MMAHTAKQEVMDFLKQHSEERAEIEKALAFHTRKSLFEEASK